MAHIFDILRVHNRRFMNIPWMVKCFQELVKRNGFASKSAASSNMCATIGCGRATARGPSLAIATLWAASQVKQNKTDTNWEGEKELVHQIAIAELALKDGNLVKAKGILERAITKAEGGGVYVGLSCAYDMLATIAYQQGDLELAQKLLSRVIETLIRLGTPETDSQIVNFTLKRSRIYNSLGQEHLAEKGFRECLFTQLGKLKNKEVIDDETGVLLVSILFWYSKFLSEKGRYDEAKAYLDNAYDVSAQVPAIQPAQVMVILYNMSSIAFIKKEYDNALRHLINAVVIGKTVDNPDLPSYYVMIGLIYMQKGLADQARVWCEGGRRSAKSYRNKDAEDEALSCLKNIGPSNIM